MLFSWTGMDIICLICHDPVRVPVQLTCFPCQRGDGGKSCNDMTRICLECARTYLELDKPFFARRTCIKCLTCDATTNPYNLKTEDAYRKDYLFMSLDAKTDYQCFHCAFSGSQSDLEKHVHSDCIYRYTVCNGRGDEGRCCLPYRVCDRKEHQSKCPFFTFCTQCEDYVPKDEYSSHIQIQHSHRQCLYCQASFPIDSEEWCTHVVECEWRPILCKLCTNRPVRRKEYLAHLQSHIQHESRCLQELTRHMAERQHRIQMAINLLQNGL